MSNEQINEFCENIISLRERTLENYLMLDEAIRNKSKENLSVIVRDIISGLVDQTRFDIKASEIQCIISVGSMQSFVKSHIGVENLFSFLSELVDLNHIDLQCLSPEEYIKASNILLDVLIYTTNDNSLLFLHSDLDNTLSGTKIDVDNSDLNNGYLTFEMQVPTMEDIAKRKLTMNK